MIALARGDAPLWARRTARSACSTTSPATISSIDAQLERALGRDRRAFEHELQRRARADQSRQALRSAGARQESELDLRQAELCAGRRDAVVARQRKLEAAAEAVAVDGRDVDLCARLDRGDDVTYRYRVRRELRIEVVDVGAGAEEPVGAGQDDRLDRSVGMRRLDCREQPRAIGK